MPAGRWITTSLITLAIAFGVGHLMQYGLTGVSDARAIPAPRPATSFRPIQTRSDASVLLGQPPDPGPAESAGAPPSLTVSDDVIPAPTLPDVAPRRLPDAAAISAPRDRTATPPDDDELGLSGFGLACEENLAAVPVNGGGARITLSVPCAPNRRVDLSFGGIEFAVDTGPEGVVDLTVPVLGARTRIEARIDGGTTLSAMAEVPEAAAYARVALSWTGAPALSVHALEFGAGAGGEGHVSQRRPGAPEGGGGYLVNLGDPAIVPAARAQIYSYPAGSAARTGTVRLSVSASVTSESCGRAVSVKTFRGRVDGTVAASKTPVQFPDCASVGRILVLKNVLEDLKLAGN